MASYYTKIRQLSAGTAYSKPTYEGWILTLNEDEIIKKKIVGEEWAPKKRNQKVVKSTSVFREYSGLSTLEDTMIRRIMHNHKKGDTYYGCFDTERIQRYIYESLFSKQHIRDMIRVVIEEGWYE